MHASGRGQNAAEYGNVLCAQSVADRALVAAVQQGDLDAFRRLHDLYIVDLLDFAFTYLRSQDDAEEIAQDLFLWIWEHRHEWSPAGGLRAYLFKAIRNRALNLLRQRRVQARFAERVTQGTAGEEPSSGTAHDALAHLAAAELGEALVHAVAALPPRCREVFLLVRERRLAYKDVAALLGISVKTVENTMNHALGVLRRRVAEWRGPADE